MFFSTEDLFLEQAHMLSKNLSNIYSKVSLVVV